MSAIRAIWGMGKYLAAGTAITLGGYKVAEPLVDKALASKMHSKEKKKKHDSPANHRVK